jgi:hypothetical protein
MAKKVIKKVSKPAAAKKVTTKAAAPKKVVAKKAAPAKAKATKKAPAKAKAKKVVNGPKTITGKPMHAQNKGVRDIIRQLIARKNGATLAQIREKLDAEVGQKNYSDSTVGTTISVINRIDAGKVDRSKNKAGDSVYRFIAD